ncbi:MAG TPA: hypothetical protein VKA01_10400 [Vicinamibacteria bacterium]|nr:hypothetical protein [Vicinamibacteria bacterium]
MRVKLILPALTEAKSPFLRPVKYAVFQPARMSGAALALETPSGRLRHLAYAAGWKKFESLWDLVIRLKRVSGMLPLLERILDLDGAPSSPRAGWSGAGARPAAAERAASS